MTQLYHRDLFLRGFDDDVRTTLAAEMRKTGIDLRMEAAPARIERAADGALHVTLRDGVRLETDASCTPPAGCRARATSGSRRSA